MRFIDMLPRFWVGLAVLILGILSLVVPIPNSESEGVSVGGVSIDIETRHKEKVSPILSGVLILGGLGAIVSGKSKRS
jgi:hypothetical protein